MERVDICIVNLGLAKSRTHAKRIITEKRAFYDGKVIEKVSMIIENPSLITINSTFEDSYVGRGAIKLDSAIKNFKLDLNNLVCMDIGASTGGFTQIMLNENAKKVYAIDVGTDQLAKSLLNDDRVVSLENINFRYLDFEVIGEKLDFISIDVSFISLKYDLTRHSIPNDTEKPMITSGIRLGSAAMTSRGFKEDEFIIICRTLASACR